MNVMDTSNMNSVSIRGMQSFLFAETLRKQMDAMESKSASSKARLERKANSYREMGLSTDEIKELISIDGKSVVKEARDAFVDMVAGNEAEEKFLWDFSIQDHRGKKWSSSTYGLHPVTAANADDAAEVAMRALRKILSPDDEEIVVDVERINF
jgi:hypothetical protein